MATTAEVGDGSGGGGGEGSVARIFVGGLAEGVGAADLEAVFASVGRVAGVEFVRTNGRSFAYVDFHCPSDKALAKLFSTYNGCKWKGGKLKLEKAKEHYLARLKKEWDQEAAAAAAAVLVQGAADKDNVVKETPKPEKAALEGTKMNLYFPKLRKVKALPFKGTGKHKYSFRHIEVPSYPIHFCDCEEHCGPPEAANDEYASVINAAACKKERTIMNSVMNKLFEKESEHFDSLEIEKHNVLIDTIKPFHAVNGLQMEDIKEVPEEDLDVTEEAPEEDLDESEESSEEDLDDDLVINIAPRKSKNLAGQAKMEKQEVNKDLQSRKQQRFEEASLQKKRQGSEASSEPRKMKQQRTSMVSDSRTGGMFLPAISQGRQNQEKSPCLTGKGTNEFSSALPSNKSSTGVQAEAVEALKSSTTKSESAQNMVATEPKKGTSWSQKSAWRDLVGGMGGTPFSISQILPSTNPAPPVVPNVTETGQFSKSLEAQVPSEPELYCSSGMLSIGGADGSAGECKENNKTQKVRVVPKITIGEAVPFVRNTESQKQWSKAKKALSGFIKKGNQSTGSSAGKGKPSRRR